MGEENFADTFSSCPIANLAFFNFGGPLLQKCQLYVRIVMIIVNANGDFHYDKTKQCFSRYLVQIIIKNECFSMIRNKI